MAYVYAYIIENKFRYIGKGNGDRDVSHLKCINNKGTKNIFHNYLRNRLKEGIKPKIIRFYSNISEEMAYYYEEGLINFFGKVIDDTGTLFNILDGGKGRSKGFKHSKETCNKISNGKKGKKFSKEHKEKLRQANLGKKFSKEHCEKISKSSKGKLGTMLGRKHTEESKLKMCNSRLGKVYSDEAKLNMSISTKKSWIKRKQKALETGF